MNATLGIPQNEPSSATAFSGKPIFFSEPVVSSASTTCSSPSLTIIEKTKELRHKWAEASSWVDIAIAFGRWREWLVDGRRKEEGIDGTTQAFAAISSLEEEQLGIESGAAHIPLTKDQQISELENRLSDARAESVAMVSRLLGCVIGVAHALGSREDSLLRLLFAYWRDTSGVTSEKKRLEDKMRQSQEATIQNAQFAAQLFHVNSQGIVHSVFEQWVKLCTQEKCEKEIDKAKLAMQTMRRSSIDRAHAAALKLMSSQDLALIRLTFDRWKDDLLERVQDKQAAAMRNSLKEQSLGVAKSAAMRLIEHQGASLVRSLFGVWKDVHVELAHHAELEKLMEQMKASAFENACTTALRLMGIGERDFKKSCVKSWQDIVAQAQLDKMADSLKQKMAQTSKIASENVHQIIKKLMASQDATLLRTVFDQWRNEKKKQKDKERAFAAVNGLAASQTDLILGAVLKAWKDLCTEALHQKEFEALQENMQETQKRQSQIEETRKQKEKERLFASVSGLASSQDNLIIGSVFKVWKDISTQERHLKECENLRKDAERRSTIEKESKYAAVMRLVASQENLIVATILQIWKELHSSEMHSKTLQSLKNEMDQQHSGEEEKRKQREKELRLSTVNGLAASQDDVIVSAVLKVWTDFCAETRHLRELQKVQDEMQEMTRREKERKFAAVQCLMASQDNMILMTILKMWKDHVKDLCSEKQLQKMQSALKEKEQRERERAFAAVGVLAASQDNLLLGTVLKAWRDLCTEAFHLRELQASEERQIQVEEQRKQREKELALSAAKGLVDSQDSLILAAVLKMWKDLHATALHVQEVQKIQAATKVREAEAACRVASFFLSSQDESTMRIMLTAWRDTLKTDVDFRKQMQQLSAKAAEAAYASVLKFLSANDKALIEAVMGLWKGICVEAKRSQDASSLKCAMDATKAKLIQHVGYIMLRRSDSQVITCVFQCWRQIGIELSISRMKASCTNQIQLSHLAVSRFLGCEDAVLIKTWFLAELALQVWNGARMETLSGKQLKRIKAKVTSSASAAAERFLCSGGKHMTQLILWHWRDNLKTSRVQKHAVTSLLASQNDLLTREVLKLWSNLVKESCASLAASERSRSMAMNLVSANGTMLVRTIFASWRECSIDAMHAKKLLQLQQEMKESACNRARCFLLNLLNSKEKEFSRFVIECWRDLCAEPSRAVQLQNQVEANHKLKMIASERSRAVLAKMLDSQIDLLLRTLVAHWKDETAEGLRGKDLLRIRIQTQQIQKSKSDTACNTALKFLNMQDDLMKRGVIGAWLDVLSVEARSKEAERSLQQQIAKLSERAAQTACSAVSQLLASQDRTLAMTCLVSWRSCIETDHRDADIEKNFKVELGLMRKAASDRAYAAVSRLLGSQEGSLVQATFGMWKQCFQDTMKDNNSWYLKQELQRLRGRNLENARSAAMRLVGSQDALVMRIALDLWKDAVVHLQAEKMKQNLSQSNLSKSKMLDGVRSAIARQFTDQHSSLLLHSLKSWSEVSSKIAMENRIGRCKAEAAALQAKSKADAQRVAIRAQAMCFGLQLQNTFEAWKEYWLHSTRQRDLKRAARNGRQMLCSHMSSAVDTLCLQVTFVSWRDLWADAKRKLQVGTLHVKRKDHAGRAAQRLLVALQQLGIRSAFDEWRHISVGTRYDTMHASLSSALHEIEQLKQSRNQVKSLARAARSVLCTWLTMGLRVFTMKVVLSAWRDRMWHSCVHVLLMRMRNYRLVWEVFYEWFNEAQRTKKEGFETFAWWNKHVHNAWSLKPAPPTVVADLPKALNWKPVLACEVISRNGPPPRTRKTAVHQARYLLASIFYAWWSSLYGPAYHSPRAPEGPPSSRPAGRASQVARAARRPQSAAA